MEVNVSALAMLRDSPAEEAESFLEPPIAARPWRGLLIRTPYFAAADFDSNKTSKLAKLGTVPKSTYWDDMKRNGENPHAMLEALRYYGVPGWSSKLSEK
jgi:hypothetical protein